MHVSMSMYNIYIQKLVWVYCTGHAGVKENDRASKAATGSVLRPKRLKMLRSLMHYLRAQSPEYHPIDRMEERGVERRSDLPRKDERGPSSIRCTQQLFQRATLGKPQRDGLDRI